MSDMKCTKCNSDLEQIGDFFACTNPHCTLCGDKNMWQELIRTRKALELAITGLKNCKTRDHIGAVCRTPEYVDKVLEQITALTKGGDNE